MTLNQGELLNDRYQVEESIEHGLSSANYRGTEKDSKRAIFIKAFHLAAYGEMEKAKKDNLYGFAHLTIPRAAQIIQVECRVRLTYHHPALPEALDFFPYNNNLIFITEWIEGTSLAEKIKQNRKKNLWPKTVVAWAIQILDALTYLHENHFIHRDIKPDNIIITSAGKPYLVDEGSARIVRTALGKKNSPSGYFCAPEFLLQPERVSPLADIYSLGTSLYYVLTVRFPIHPLELDEGKLIFDPADPAPNVPESLLPVITKAMALHPESRYKSAAEMKTALEEILPTLPEEPQPAPKRPAIKAVKEIAPEVPLEPQKEPALQEVLVPEVEEKKPPEKPVEKKPQKSSSTAKKKIDKEPEESIKVPSRKKVIRIAAIVGPLLVALAIILAIVINKSNAARLEQLHAQQTVVAYDSTQQAFARQTAEMLNRNLTATAEAAAATQRAGSTATAWAYATLQSVAALSGGDINLAEKAHMLTGPESGQLKHILDGKPEMYCLNYSMKNFIASARFNNPFNRTEGYWDYGFVFRKDATYSYRLVFFTDQNYSLELWKSFQVSVQYGTKKISQFNNAYPAENVITLVAQDNTASLYVNGQLATTLDISKQSGAGQVCVATALYASHEYKNKSTGFSDFYLWELP
jgi:serine/threonine protein kinase